MTGPHGGAGALAPQDTRRLQSVLFEMLAELDRICRTRGIKYSLFMGTLLGAVRHRGFIPWDDDLDVAMLRDDYRKFAAACREVLDEQRFFFQDHATDPHYRWGYARLRRKDSEFVRLGQEHMKMRTGIFIDIFPIDGVPERPLARALHRAFCYSLRKILYAEAGRKTSTSVLLRAWYGVLSFVPHSWALNAVERLADHTGATRFCRVITFPLPKRAQAGFARDWFEDMTELSFERAAFPCPRDHDAALQCLYGDYMRLPPPEQRICTHPAAKFRLPPLDGGADLDASRPGA
jgi:lipopolysaccharide cholinephosphotransferase